MIRLCLLAASFGGVATAAPAESPRKPRRIDYAEPKKLAELENRRISESSGIAASRRRPGVLWTHNDSGDKPRLYALNREGKDRGTFLAAAVKARDWEDMCAFISRGTPYLLVGDIGDNARRRDFLTLYLLEEPPLSRRVARWRQTVHFRFPDGKYDCEGLGYDTTSGDVLVITKNRGQAARVYRFAWPGKNNTETITAEHIGTLKLTYVTGMDISSAGDRMIVSTYLSAAEYVRGEEETWADALRRKPRIIDLPPRRQGESICYGLDGVTIYVTSEGVPTPLWEVAPE